jgi:hypothetical protein
MTVRFVFAISLFFATLYSSTSAQTSQSSDGTWRAEIIMRLAGSGDFDVAKDGTLRNISGQGAMLVYPDGKPEWLLCPPNISWK